MNGNTQNGVKRRHRIEATIEPEHVLVEIGLQVLWLDATMMRSINPSFQIAEHKVDHWQVRLSFIWVATKRQHVVAVSHLRESGIARPSREAAAAQHKRCACAFCHHPGGTGPQRHR
jgi:hypothetical protein